MPHGSSLRGWQQAVRNTTSSNTTLDHTIAQQQCYDIATTHQLGQTRTSTRRSRIIVFGITYKNEDDGVDCNHIDNYVTDKHILIMGLCNGQRGVRRSCGSWIRTSTTQICDDSTPLVAPQRYSIPTPAIDGGSIADNEDTSYQVKNVFWRSGDRNSPPQPETAPAETTDYTSSPTSGSTTGPDMAAATPTPRASQPVTESKAEATPPTPTLETAAKSYSIIDVHECFRCPTIEEVDLLQRTYTFTIGEKDWKKSFKKGCIKCYTASYCNSTCQSNDWKSHKDYCKHARKPENKTALARYNQRAQSFDTLGMDLADKAVTDLGYRRLERYELGKGAILLNWDQLQQLPPGILNLTRTASLLDDDDDDAEANINVDGDVNNETTDDTHQKYYYHDIVKQGDYYPQERGEPALATFVSRSTTTPGTYTGTKGSEKRNKADTIHIVVDTDDEDNSTPSGDHALSTVAQRRPPAPDLLDSGANRYVFGSTTATITDRKEARVTSLKNISGQPRRITQQATVQPLWVGGTGRTYSPRYQQRSD
eukprot:g15849.t1